MLLNKLNINMIKIKINFKKLIWIVILRAEHMVHKSYYLVFWVTSAEEDDENRAQLTAEFCSGHVILYRKHEPVLGRMRSRIRSWPSSATTWLQTSRLRAPRRQWHLLHLWIPVIKQGTSSRVGIQPMPVDPWTNEWKLLNNCLDNFIFK